MEINYKRLAIAIESYKLIGYVNIDAPWWVSKEAVLATAPKDIDYLYELPNGKCLVASGEQSFLYLIMKGYLAPGMYQTTTPCFRYEQQGSMRRKGFMKTELINTAEVSSASLQNMIKHAMAFFKVQVPLPELIKLVETDAGFDINYGDIELGSYGIRNLGWTSWVYGTGCAEPRLSSAIAMIGKK